jgi:hypothetical protein
MNEVSSWEGSPASRFPAPVPPAGPNRIAVSPTILAVRSVHLTGERAQPESEPTVAAMVPRTQGPRHPQSAHPIGCPASRMTSCHRERYPANQYTCRCPSGSHPRRRAFRSLLRASHPWPARNPRRARGSRGRNGLSRSRSRRQHPSGGAWPPGETRRGRRRRPWCRDWRGR